MKPKSVLLIEDDPIVTKIYGRFLEANGFAVRIAKSGAGGLEALSSETPDAVILDWMMPQVNGLAVLKAIRANERLRTLPVIVFTAAHVPALVEQALTAGANRVFDKTNDKPIAVTGYLHDLFGTSVGNSVVVVSNSGNTAGGHWPPST